MLRSTLRWGAPFFLLFAWLFAGPLLTQERTGLTRLQGRVLDLDDRPISAAAVSLRSVESPGRTPRSTETDRSGRWSIVGLETGRWEITVKAREYRMSLGWIDVLESESSPTVTVWMRPLDEVTPSWAENEQTVIGFIEMGNDLLEQGLHARARQEYEKAMISLPEESRPEILRSVARTHFLEGSIDKTIAALRRALAMAPDDAATRQLLRTVLAQQGRLAEAEGLLAAADRGEPLGLPAGPEDGEETGLAIPVAPAQLPIESLSVERSGRYRARLSATSPVSDLTEILRRLGVDRRALVEHDPRRGQYSLVEESFRIYVPETPPPAGFGVMVWISPTPFGGFVGDEIGALLDDHGLIWIGADNAGNRRLGWYRMMLALDAVHNLDATYPVDDRRIFIAGYSGGGRITSALSQLYPEIFRGGLSLFGCDYMEKVPIPFKPGASWPPAYPPPPREKLRGLKREGRFVLVTGELDFNRAQTKATFERMAADGFENVATLVIPGASHYHDLERSWLDRSLRFLDGGPRPEGPGWSTVRP